MSLMISWSWQSEYSNAGGVPKPDHTGPVGRVQADRPAVPSAKDHGGIRIWTTELNHVGASIMVIIIDHTFFCRCNHHLFLPRLWAGPHNHNNNNIRCNHHLSPPRLWAGPQGLSTSLNISQHISSQALSGPSRGATQYTAAGLLADCHTNATLFNILKLEEVVEMITNSMMIISNCLSTNRWLWLFYIIFYYTFSWLFWNLWYLPSPGVQPFKVDRLEDGLRNRWVERGVVHL